MAEFAVLAALNRLMAWGRAPVIASRTIVADAAVLFTLVSDPVSQWRLVAGFSPRLRPQARVEATGAAQFVTVRVRLLGRDALWLTWLFTPTPGMTDVDIAAQPHFDGVLARLVLALGGRRWLRHRLEATLGTMARMALCSAEDLYDIERGAAPAPTFRPRGAAT